MIKLRHFGFDEISKILFTEIVTEEVIVVRRVLIIENALVTIGQGLLLTHHVSSNVLHLKIYTSVQTVSKNMTRYYKYFFYELMVVELIDIDENKFCTLKYISHM